MIEIYKGTSGQNRYLLLTERDARQVIGAKPNLKFYRCKLLGEFDAVLGGLPTLPKVELCNRLNIDAGSHDAYLLSQFKAGSLHLYYTGATHYTLPDKKLTESAESTFYLAPAIYGLEYSGVQFRSIASNPSAANQYIQHFNLDDNKVRQLINDFYANTGDMYKNGAPQFSSLNLYKDHLLKLLVDGDAIVIEKPKSLFIPVEEIISTAVGVSVLRPNQVKESVEEEPDEEPEESQYYFSIILIDKKSNPLTGVPYDLSFFKSESNKSGEPIQKIKGGSSDAEGYVEHKLPVGAEYALLEYAPYPTRPDLILKMGLKVGELEDASTEAGMRSRLNHFGYFSGEEGIASNDSELFAAQLESFQDIYGLSGNDGVISYFENQTAIA